LSILLCFYLRMPSLSAMAAPEVRSRCPSYPYPLSSRDIER
jgi:hypothetical protein